MNRTECIRVLFKGPMGINTYNEFGELVTKNLHEDPTIPSQFLQSMDYQYNIRGWLNAINDSDLDFEDWFGMKLSYDNPENGGTVQFNVNIYDLNGNILSLNRMGNDGTGAVVIRNARM